MKSLITGQAGFVGSYLADYLTMCGDTIVPFEDPQGDGVDVTDASAVASSIVGSGVDVVYHLAALTHVGESWDAPATVWRVNTEGTLNVLQAAAREGARVVVVTSADAYGRVPPDTLIDEACPLRPLSPYGASKAAAEVIALQSHRGADVEVIVARAFNHTGPGQPARFVVPALAARVAEAATSGASAISTGNLDVVRDISHVRDVVAAYRTLAEQGEPGEVYNVCSAQAVSIREIAQFFIGAAGGEVGLTIDPDLVRPVDVPWLVGDNAKIRSTTSWEPARNLDATLNDIWRAASVIDA